jgi:glutathione S-transferase
MKLYGIPPSPNTWKVRAVAAHLGLPLELQIIDVGKGDNRTPGYLALNPTGRTPTLVDGSTVLWESNAILQYLGDRKPNTLWPNDPRARADIMRWQSWQLAHWGRDACDPLLFEVLVKRFFNWGPPDAAVVAKATQAFHREAPVLDAHLAKQPYLAGSELTLADFAVAAPLFHKDGAELPLAPYAKVQEWFARVSALPAWRDAAPAPMPAAA